jgi:hypothetical protein
MDLFNAKPAVSTSFSKIIATCTHIYYLNVMSCDVQLGGPRFPFILSLILAKYFLENGNASLTLPL